MSLLKRFILITLFSTLFACGQKGALVYPQQPEAEIKQTEQNPAPGTNSNDKEAIE